MMRSIMSATPQPLPDDVDALKAVVLAQAQQLSEHGVTLDTRAQTIAQQHTRLSQQDEQIRSLHDRIKELLNHRFGSSSEKLADLDASQIGLFDEPEAEPEEDAESAPTTVVAKHTRRGKRAPLPKHLPRVERIHDLADEQKVCPHDGTALTRIGEQTAERLDIIPMTVQVIKDIRLTYASPCCNDYIVTADKPATMIPKAMASEGLLAYIVTSKYVDAMPLNRISKMLARIGTEIPRQTLASWMVRCAERIAPLIERFAQRLNQGRVIQMDETRVQVLDEPGKTAQSQSYMWVRTGGDEVGTPIRLFDYAPSRSGQVPIDLLQDFKGTLHTDGYKGYAAVVRKNALTSVACWAHTRRYYVKALKVAGITNLKQIPAKPPPKAKRLLKALSFIQKLYGIERLIRDEPFAQRAALRQEKARPVLDEFKQWIEKTQPKVLPSSGLGKALAYTTNHWIGLTRYLDDGRLEIDTNRTENAIRPFVVGRKNWIFSASQNGAKASAALYSLIETAKANGHEPYAYLRKVFETLPNIAVDDIDELLPWNIGTT